MTAFICQHLAGESEVLGRADHSAPGAGLADARMPGSVPEALKEHILPFRWDVRKVWALEAEVRQLPCREFAYLLELPLWSSVPRRGLLFDTRPIDVIRDAHLSPYQTRRLQEAELEYPIDILAMDGRRWILDGVHRIAGHFVRRNETLAVRLHDESAIPAIKGG